MVAVELIYITLLKETIHLRLELRAGTSVAEAIEQSGILNTHPEVKDLKIGIFSKPVSLDTVLKNGDRIECYRPLLSSPKEKRRERAK